MLRQDEISTVQININDKTFILHKGESIFQMLLRQEMIFLSFCGGKGRCGRCRIKFHKGTTLPSASDRLFLTPDEIRSGIRLACTSKPKTDCVIDLIMEEKKDTKIISSYDLSDWEDSKYEESEPKAVIAVDIGTTTLAMQLILTLNSHIEAEYRKMNPQRAYGPDVISRIEADGRGEGSRMQKLIRDEVEHGIRILLEQYKLQFKETDANNRIPVVIAGNTVMQHIFMGFSTATLGIHPFTPVDVREQKLQIAGENIAFMPGISAFVGADIVAGVYALKMCSQENQSKVSLLIDLGTNGEMALGNAKRLLVSATAAGPAFEGRSISPMDGTDLIDITAKLLEQGILDETGLMVEPYFEQGYQYKNNTVTQEDIRALQMAKAAICAGIRIMMREYPITPEEIDTVYLAGGFGYYLDSNSAAIIGLIPEELAGKVKAVGNTSLMGAYLYGRNADAREEVLTITELAIPVNLAEQEGFEENYLESLHFPQQDRKENHGFI